MSHDNSTPSNALVTSPDFSDGSHQNGAYIFNGILRTVSPQTCTETNPQETNKSGYLACMDSHEELKEIENDSKVLPKTFADLKMDLEWLTLEVDERAKRRQDFLDRQKTHSGMKVRLQHSKVQRGFLENCMREDNAKFLGAKGVKGFRSLLCTRYGTVPAAWRLLLDKDGSGRLSWSEFCQACRELGYSGNLKQLWSELDADGDGFISLWEIDYQAAKALKSFHALVIERFGCMLQAWHYLDIDKNHRLDEIEFVNRCQALGWEGNAHKLFRWLMNDMGRNYLTLLDLDPESQRAKFRGDDHMQTVKTRNSYSEVPPPISGSEGFSVQEPKKASSMSPSLPGLPQKLHHSVSVPNLHGSSPHASSQDNTPSIQHSSTVGFLPAVSSPVKSKFSESTVGTRWVRTLSVKQRYSQYQEQEKMRKKNIGLQTLSGLRKLLISRFGSIYSAWRQALDLDGNGRLSFGEFCFALRQLGYQGNMKAIWSYLDQDNSGFISLNELDPKVSAEIDSYKTIAKQKYGNMLLAWLRGLDKDNLTQVDEKLFTEHCKEIGWTGDAHSLFQNLKEDLGRHFITLRDYDIQAYHAFIRGDLAMISESHEIDPNKSNMSFEERQFSTFKQRWERSQAKAKIEMRRSVVQEAKERDVGATSLASLKAVLVRKFGTIVGAWRNGLDLDGNGKLTFGEFCEALRRLGYTGNLKQLWAELGGNHSHVTLRMLDPEAHKATKTFRTLLMEKYGSIMKAWKDGLDTNHNGTVEEHELIERCQELGYEGDAKQLFNYLIGEPSRRFITMADLDPEAMQAFYRGDLRVMDCIKGEVDPAQQHPLFAKVESKFKRGTMTSEWNQHLGEKRRSDAFKASQDEAARRLGPRNLETFKKSLKEQYGSIVAAWRTALDVDGSGSISYGELCAACRNTSYIGNIKLVWQMLDADGSGTISLKELDSKAYETLRHFREHMVASFGILLVGWYDCLDAKCSGRLAENDFLEGCKKMNYEKGEEKVKKLFRLLLPDKLTKYLVVSDIETLLIGLPKTEHEAILGRAPGLSENRKAAVKRASFAEARKSLSRIEFPESVGASAQDGTTTDVDQNAATPTQHIIEKNDSGDSGGELGAAAGDQNAATSSEETAETVASSDPVKTEKAVDQSAVSFDDSGKPQPVASSTVVEAKEDASSKVVDEKENDGGRMTSVDAPSEGVKTNAGTDEPAVDAPKETLSPTNESAEAKEDGSETMKSVDAPSEAINTNADTGEPAADAPQKTLSPENDSAEPAVDLPTE